MADNAGTQIVRGVLDALKRPWVAETFEPVAPVPPIPGARTFSLRATLSGEPYTLGLKTTFHVVGGLPGTIRFEGRPLELTLTRNDNGASARRKLDYKIRQLGDDVTVLIPPASIVSKFESAAAEISPG